ncbi:hypothetical protein J7E38_13655 [Bacillus sp. ISL-35]|uniref:phage tail protein n=1 Tax=Bacillus sp. ISL-35 TaxID=2819122 RepID=UPI001BE8677D|nr:hypothetical protein [Bacillus sp. ISL-35]MBT2680055.1 hypothetical protein [Bacillus sp. ISL-35]MBT2702968.1 hypothetical protein [Chryseobacterium sp. ISL-80]
MQENFAAKITADINEFMRQMTEVDEAIRRTAFGATASITADITNFISSIQRANSELNEIPSVRETNIQADVTRFNRQMQQVQAKVLALTREVNDLTAELSHTQRQMQRTGNQAIHAGNQMFNAGYQTQRMYRGTSEEARRMSQEMRSAFAQQSLAMSGFRDEMIKAEYEYFKLAQGAKTYSGSNQQFMADVAAMGAAHKKATDNMMKNNELMKISMIQTAGTMLNMSTQAEKISANYDRMKNPLLQVNKGSLAVANSLNKMANAGNASVLALKMLGPTANMKELNDMTRMITQGMMRFQMVAIGAAVTSALVYSSLHKGAMDTVKGYEESLNRMKAAVRQAFQPMVDVFGAVMMKIYDFITAIANMTIKFNEAHPVLAKIIQGTMMLVPALTLLLSPLAVGIGLVAGFKAALASVWPLITPIVTGLAAMSATVWIVAAAIVALTAGFIYLWKTNDGFRNAIISAWNSIKAAAMIVWGFLLPYINQAITAVSTFIKQRLDQIKQFWDENGAQIIQALSNAWSIIKTIFSAAMAVIVPILGVAWMIIKSVIISTWNAIKNIINGALNVIQGIIKVFAGIFTGDFSKVWEGIKQIFKGALQILWGWINLYFIGKFLGPLKGFASTGKTLMKSAWNFIKGIFTNTLNTIKSFVTGSFNAVNRTISSVMNAIKQVIVSIWNSIRSTINTVTSTIKSIVTGVFNRLKSTVSTAMKNVKTAIVNGWNAAKSFLSSINLSGIGKNIIQGLIKGIGSMMGAVADKIKDVAGSIKSGITKALSIHSPSRWMRDMVGKNIVSGVIVGIDKMTGAAAKTTANMASAITGAFSPQLAVANMEINRTSLDAGFQIDEIKQQVKDELSVDLVIHHISGQASQVESAGEKEPRIFQLVTPQGRVLAEWIADDVTEVQNQKKRLHRHNKGKR